MKYVVCMKQVPKFSKVEIDKETHNLIREGLKVIINPPDRAALAFALKLREETGGEVKVISMGPPNAVECVKEAIALGADGGAVLCSGNFRGSDTLATAYTLAEGIKKMGDFDVVLTGTQSSDGDTGQVGPEIAENLSLNQCSYITKVEYKDGYFEAVRDLGTRLEKHRIKSPVLFSVIRDSIETKDVKLKDIEAVDDSLVKVYDEKDLNLDLNRIGVKGSPSLVVDVFDKEKMPTGVFVEGDIESQVEKIANMIKESGFIG